MGLSRRNKGAGERPYQFPKLRKAIIAAGYLVAFILAADAYHAFQANRHVAHASHHLDQARDAVSHNTLDKADQQVALAGRDTRAAAAATNGVIWRLSAQLPVIGSSFTTARVLTHSADVVTRQILPSTISAGTILTGHRLKNADGSINLDAISSTQPIFAAAVAGIEHQQTVAIKTRPGYVAGQRNAYLRQLADLDRQLTKFHQASASIPDMLGATTPRRYFLGFLTNAEARSTGGFLGAYAILKADHGRLSFERFGTDTDLKPAAQPVVDLGQRFDLNYGYADVAQTWTESTIDPHFPDVGAIWVGLWKAQTGEHLDGAFAIDPFGLAALLQATGPVTAPDGQLVSADNVVQLVESDAYTRFGDANEGARKQFLLAIAKSASQTLIHHQSNAGALIDAIKPAAHDQRFHAYASNPVNEVMIRGTDVSGELPAPGRPLAYLLVDNAAANKMEYYLKRSVTYLPVGCGKPAEITLQLQNTLTDPSPLPLAVVGHIPSLDYPLGTIIDVATLYLNGTATYHGVTINGKPAGQREILQHGLTAVSWNVFIPPGQTTTIALYVDSDPPGTPRIIDQPLVIPPTDTVLPAPRCAK